MWHLQQLEADWDQVADPPDHQLTQVFMDMRKLELNECLLSRHSENPYILRCFNPNLATRMAKHIWVKSVRMFPYVLGALYAMFLFAAVLRLCNHLPAPAIGAGAGSFLVSAIAISVMYCRT